MSAPSLTTSRLHFCGPFFACQRGQRQNKELATAATPGKFPHAPDQRQQTNPLSPQPKTKSAAAASFPTPDRRSRGLEQLVTPMQQQLFYVTGVHHRIESCKTPQPRKAAAFTAAHAHALQPKLRWQCRLTATLWRSLLFAGAEYLLTKRSKTKRHRTTAVGAIVL